MKLSPPSRMDGEHLPWEVIVKWGDCFAISPLTPALPMNPPAHRATTSHENSGSWYTTICSYFRGNLHAGIGRDAFHCVPNCRSKDGDAVERVPTGFRGSRRELVRRILSPLRGEGDTSVASIHAVASRSPEARAPDAARSLIVVGKPRRAPSPLNGERAGVRGEMVWTRAIQAPSRSAPQSHGPPPPALAHLPSPAIAAMCLTFP
jgi:hypothetical protein